MEAFSRPEDAEWSTKAKINVLPYRHTRRIAPIKAKIRFDFFMTNPFYLSGT